MKVNREILTQAGLELLNEVGLEDLTLRLLGEHLKIQAATLYWHFKSKEQLIDEMATTILAKGAERLLPVRGSSDWMVWATAFGQGLRKALLAYRDGARVVAGSRLTNTDYMQTVERIAARLVESGFTVRRVAVLLSTVYDYTLSLVMEEQAVFPVPGKRAPQYDVAARNAALDPKQFPLLREAGTILFDRFDRRHKEGLELIILGAATKRTKKRRREADLD